MRRLSLFSVLFALVGLTITAIIARSWADAPAPPAAAKDAKNNDDPFGDSGDVKPAKPSGQSAAETSPLAAASKPPAQASQGVRGMAFQPPPIDRILTAEMAASHAPLTAVDALSETESAAVAKINAALASKTEIDFRETPLKEVIEYLKKRHKIEIQLDAGGLKDAGVEPDTPVTKHLSGVSLRSALRLLLDELQLKYVIHNEVLLVTSPQKAESDEFMLTRIYPVKDLILVRNVKNEIQTDYQPLIDLIVNSVSTKSWLDNGGNGTISPCQLQDRCLLVINQTQEVHEEIDDLLAALRRCAPDEKSGNDLRLPKLPKGVDNGLPPPPRALSMGSSSTGIPASALTGGTSSQPAVPSGLHVITVPQSPPRFVRILTPEMAASPEPKKVSGEETPAEAKILAALSSRTEINCEDLPLHELVDQLKDRHKIDIQLDPAGLKDAGVDTETHVKKHLSGISLRAALRLLLDELQLMYVVHNEVLLITSPQKAESDEFMTTRCYFVKELILVRNENGEIETDFQALEDLIQNTVATKTWTDNGGNGSIPAYQFKDRCLLVISQTQEVHEQISDLLLALRRCAASDAKNGGELRLPRRPKVAGPPFQGGGYF